MKLNGIEKIIPEGRHRIDGVNILGKGHTGIVLKASTIRGPIALKVLRTDANRPNFNNEVRYLKIANNVKIGPKLISWTNDMLMMEFVDGPYLGDWIKSLTKNDESKLRGVLRNLIDQARRLDMVGLDHGELVRVKHHIILGNTTPVIIDFESASTERRVVNVTTVIQSFFMNNKTSSTIKKIMTLPQTEVLLEKLKLYKHNSNEKNYNDLLKTLNL
jgi:putative serine/threonine protein kinase